MEASQAVIMLTNTQADENGATKCQPLTELSKCQHMISKLDSVSYHCMSVVSRGVRVGMFKISRACRNFLSIIFTT